MFGRLILCVLLITSIACSRSKTSDEVIENVEGIETIEQLEDFESELEDERVVLDTTDDESGVLVETQPIEEPTALEEEIDNVEVSLNSDPALANIDQYQERAMPTNGNSSYSTYTIQENETLMLIAFKLYGDYSRWQELASLNNLSDSRMIFPGKKLKYSDSGAGFNFNPQGSPYLIKKNDTLSIISNKVYGAYGKWRPIWQNNRPLIKDPDKIFAGFTIFYPDSN